MMGVNQKHPKSIFESFSRMFPQLQSINGGDIYFSGVLGGWTICKPARHVSHANFAFKSKHSFQIALIDKQLLSLSTHFKMVSFQ